MTPRLRKFALIVHVVSSVGLLGAIASFLALAIAGVTSQNAHMARAASLAMELIAAGGLLVLLVPAVLSVYKPRGRTQYGVRKEHEQRALLQPHELA